MGRPTQQELSDYFFNNCDRATSEKIEKWFLLHGKSRAAETMLYKLWTDIDCSMDSEGIEETKAAFERFSVRLTESGTPSERLNPFQRIYSWFSRIATVLLIPLALLSVWLLVGEDRDVEWVEKSVAYGETDYVVLPDGSSVWINSGSKIIYPKEFKGGSRQIFFSGEGYFDVAGNRHKPFNIKTGESTVSVLGTEFNLKSYPEDKRMSVSLLSGSVSFIPSKDAKEVMLTPGDILEYDKEARQMRRTRFNASKSSFWKDGKLYFKNSPLADIARQLERHFDVEIVILTDSLKTIPYHMAFVNNESLDEILAVIDSESRIRVEKKGRIVEIY